MKSYIYPVIHYLDMKTTLANAAIAVNSGCAGVFLIHMNGQDTLLTPALIELRKLYPDLFIGINRLSCNAAESVELNLACKADATWVDNCGILNGQMSPLTNDINRALANSDQHKVFGAVAFKYQREDFNPPASAKLALSLEFIPTTSGPGTGHAPDLSKIKSMADVVERENLAIASGITPENITEFLPYCAHFLVSTGISKTFYEFDSEKVASLVRKSK